MTDELTDRTITTKEERVNSVEATPNPPETVLRRTKKDFRDMFFFLTNLIFYGRLPKMFYAFPDVLVHFGNKMYI